MPEPERQLHERLGELLPSARGETCDVVATFLDIRGFSTFSMSQESFNAARYLRSAYSRILTQHFPDANFYKPTGDGLLLIHDLPDDSSVVPRSVSSILTRGVALVNAFGELTADDYMVNFPVPKLLGIGVARGTATRLVSDGFVLDYTGRCLNLAARLMDKARPYGVVFSDSHAEALMEPELAVKFHEDHAYIRGIAEEKAIAIWATSTVKLSDADHEPIKRSGRIYGSPSKLAVAKVREMSDHGFYLPREPHTYEVVGVHVEYPNFDEQGKLEETVSSLDLLGRVEQHPGGTVIYVPLGQVQRRVKDLPAATTSTFVGFSRTKTTYVTFTPYLEPAKRATASSTR